MQVQVSIAVARSADVSGTFPKMEALVGTVKTLTSS